MADYLIQDTTLDAIADAINAKTGGSSAMTPAQMVTAIGSISGGGGSDNTLVELVEGTLSGAFHNEDITKVLTPFSACAALTSISLPNCTEVGRNGFANCASLTQLYLPKLTTTSSSGNSFEGSKLVYLVLPSLSNFTGSYNCRNMSTLIGVDFGTPGGIGLQTFASDTNLSTIVLRNTSARAALAGISAFNGTPFASGGAGGTIYIKKALFDHLGDGSDLDYKASTNWSIIDGYGTITWAKIEGSIYETQYVDGTPIPTT